jgi:hypothetical protein
VKTKPFLIGLIAVMVAMLAASIYLSLTVVRTDKSVVSAKSPDGRYKAVLASLTRADDPAFCVDSIAVFLSVYPDSFVESDKVYEVFSAPCATITGRVPPPQMAWVSNTQLRITYSPPPAPDRPKVKLKPMDASKFVHIEYVER